MTKPLLARKTLLFSLIFFVSSLLLFEIILRVSGKGHVRDVHTASQEVFDQIPGMFEPGQDLIKLSIPQLPHRVSINSLGFRGPEVRLRNHILRILCIGDSFTFGDYVNDDETFPYYLQKLFQETSSKVEVINGGVGGTTIVDHLYFLRKSMRINPDIVVLTFSENDVSDLRDPQPMYLALESNRKLKSTPVVGTLYQLFRDTALFNFALEVRAQYHNFQLERMAGGDVLVDSGRKCDETLWKRYEGLLKEMQRYLYTNSVKFMLVIYPYHNRWIRPDQGCGAFHNQVDRLEHLAKDMGIATLNLLPAFKRSNVDVRELYLLPYDAHPSKEAYKIAANAIFRFLQGGFPEVLLKADINAKSN